MYVRDLNRERKTLEENIKSDVLDFTRAYLSVADLHSLVQTNPAVVRPETISVLQRFLERERHSSQTQAFFLYREAAETLTAILVKASRKPLAVKALSALRDILRISTQSVHRAVTEAVGCLPVSVHGPEIVEEPTGNTPCVEWQDVVREHGLAICGVPALFGRSLVAAVDQESTLFVVKLACDENAFRAIYKEAVWMDYLRTLAGSLPARFDIPAPVRINGSYLFRLMNPPPPVPEYVKLNRGCYGIAYFADRDYFFYPNGNGAGKRLAPEAFAEVMFRNAWLLGKLTSSGIVHSAPIPLFHNRLQRNRRGDNGIYEWERAGRLDRWLDSCRYPNIGVTGIRDFEHLVAFRNSRNLYRQVGTHLLSLLLVAGSYFRNRDPQRVGLDRHGLPIDARDLFDEPLFRKLIEGIFLNYYGGFCERKFAGQIPFDLEKLASRMIEEMGVDRYMEEVLRVVDQKEMTHKEFRSFLKNTGYTEDQIRDIKKGARDITVYTGPHLGGFNQSISLPELIEFVGTASALCIAGRYWSEKFPMLGQSPKPAQDIQLD